MPDTTVLHPRPQLAPEVAFVLAHGRVPALPGFLARRLLRLQTPPVVGSRAHLVETCRAEIDWSVADWRRLFPAHEDRAEYGSHPSEAYRLPHEHAAARLVNCHGHLDTIEFVMRGLIDALKSQRRASTRMDQSEAYRAGWQEKAVNTAAVLGEYLPRLRTTLSAYRKAGAEYRRLRSLIDSPSGAPCMQRAAA